ncbi:MAG: hypothetical protein C0625_08010 [Arcobacter sp.]|nr:MAG: hypothetical protein C0625_08010 [Arcobacter sp.]
MPKMLTDINITHISLVKAGANKKEIIYKSSANDPLHSVTIDIKKSDEEKGIIYGIVYAPNSVDTDDEYTTADEIVKAAYGFMKSKNTANVDKDHSFENEKAFVAESWIIKENDAVFPDEPIGSWAVAIKLEDEELKKGVKDGDIAGISMAGTATKVQDIDDSVNKAIDKITVTDLVEALKKVFGYVGFSVNAGYDKQIDKSKKEGDSEDMSPEEFQAALEKAMEPLTTKIEGLEEKVETLEKSNNETKEALKKSKQNDNPAGVPVEKEDSIGGIL